MVVHSMRMKQLPSPISGIVKPLQVDLEDYRVARNSAFNMEQPRVNNKAFSHHSKPRLAIVWNQLPESVKSGPLQTFKRDLKEYYFHGTIQSVKSGTARPVMAVDEFFCHLIYTCTLFTHMHKSTG